MTDARPATRLRGVAPIIAAALLASCAAGSVPPGTPAPEPTPASTPSLPPGDIGLGRFVDTRDFSVTFAAWSPDGEETARQLASALPDAWTQATGGRGRVSVRAGDAEIHILVLNMPGVSTGGGRGITLRIAGTRVGTAEVRVLIHEIAHSLGCCFGVDVDGGGHWVTCEPRADIMCARGSSSMTFSEREIRALRLD